MKVNLNYSNSSIKNLSLQDTFKIIFKKKVIIQKGYKEYRPLWKMAKWLHNNQKNIWSVEGCWTTGLQEIGTCTPQGNNSFN